MEGPAVIIALCGLVLLSAVIGLKLWAAARAAPPGRRGRAILAQIGTMILTVVMILLVIAGITLIRVAIAFVVRGGTLN